MISRTGPGVAKMHLTRLPTQFAPAERASTDIVVAQAERFVASAPDIRVILDAIPDIVIVLNEYRQIILANRGRLALFGHPIAEVVGLRPGEVLGCIHASESEGGCGTTAFCSTCGAVRAILTSQSGQADVQECRIIVKGSGDALDLRVWAVPYKSGDDKLTVFTLHDIRDEKRRRVLERIFFHDVLNTATAINLSSHAISEADPPKLADQVDLLRSLVDRLIEEIKSQRELLSAENNELNVKPIRLDPQALWDSVVEIYRGHPVAAGRFIEVAPSDERPLFASDPTLLRRVLGNMLKNTLEATEPGGTVRLGYRLRESGESIEFWVFNQAAMPNAVQLQIFQRSFSTKGSGRGLGTYSMKLLSERYLQGKVAFDSSPAAGTTFRVIYPLQLKIAV